MHGQSSSSRSESSVRAAAVLVVALRSLAHRRAPARWPSSVKDERMTEQVVH